MFNKKIFISLVAFSILMTFTSIIKTKTRLNEIYAKHTGKDIKEVESIMERDKYFSPDEAIKFGLIDKVVENRK